MEYDSYRPSEKQCYDDSPYYEDEKPLQVSRQYICNRCKRGGHHVLQCPTNEDPHFDVIPDASYVCMFCVKKGDHYRMFCPDNPGKNSMYKRRLAKGLVEDTKVITSNLSSFALRTSPSTGTKNTNLIPLGENSHKRRHRSDSISPITHRAPVSARLHDEHDTDFRFERSKSPSPEIKYARRNHKRIRIEADQTVQNTYNEQEERKNGPMSPINDNRKSHILTQLRNGPGNIGVNKRPTRLTALDMWEVNDIRKLRQKRYSDDQAMVPFQEDIDKYVQVKDVYEQGGRAWENALEDLIEDAYKSLSGSDETSA